jgi:integrase
MLAIPLHPALAAIIEATPSDHLTFLTTSFGKPFTAAGFGNFFRERCNEAGLSPDCAAHGLRKAACRQLAEAGCSANVIASISGHTTLTEVSRYTKAADQERMARDGMAAITRTGSGNGG